MDRKGFVGLLSNFRFTPPNDRRGVNKWEREAKRLREQNLILQRQSVLQDPLASGKAGAILDRYLTALAWIVEISDANKGRHYDDTSKPTGRESPRPNPVSAWAADTVTRELRWIDRQTLALEQWVESPHPTRRNDGRVRRRCETCGRGLGRGHRFCSSCGTRFHEGDKGGGGEGKDA